jgi:hypothetical protein
MAEEEGGEHKGGSVVPAGVKGKIGPLPIWAWVVVAAGLLGVLIIIRRGSTTPSTVGGAALPAAPAPASDGSGTPVPDNSSGQATDPMATADLLQAIKDLTNVMITQKSTAATTIPQSGGVGDPTVSLGRNVNPADANLNNPFINTYLHGGPNGGPLVGPLAAPYMPNAETSAQWQDYLAFKAQQGSQGGRPRAIGWSTSRTTGGSTTARVATRPDPLHKRPGSP